MKKTLGILVLAAMVSMALASCAHKARVIPVRKMEKIYREMFLADQWLIDNPSKRAKADTTWYYEPIFEKYGYDVRDYRKTVDHYLSDPKRFAEMMQRVVDDMNAEEQAIHKGIELRNRQKSRADSIAAAMKAYAPDDFVWYGDIFYVNSMTDRIEIMKNSKGAYRPVPVIEDTIYHGPELLIRDSAAVQPVPEPLKIPWKE